MTGGYKVKPVIITIDGPRVSGKSIITVALSRMFNMLAIDTDMFFCKLAKLMLNHHIDTNSDKCISDFYNECEFGYAVKDNQINVYINGQTVDEEIGFQKVDSIINNGFPKFFVDSNGNLSDEENNFQYSGGQVSTTKANTELFVTQFDFNVYEETLKIRINKTVRKGIKTFLESVSQKYHIVVCGTELGTYFLADAQVKLFVTATTEDRVNWFFDRMMQQNTPMVRESLISHIKYCDKKNSENGILMISSDAVILDYSSNTIEMSIFITYDICRDIFLMKNYLPGKKLKLYVQPQKTKYPFTFNSFKLNKRYEKNTY